jgi:hypothetical protein
VSCCRSDPSARITKISPASLRDAGTLTDEDARGLRWLDAFGGLIGNTDRHQYNVLFFAEGRNVRLAPAFDHVSMLYAPTADGRVLSPAFTAPNVTSDTLAVWDEARGAAREFWARGSEDARVSDDVRWICEANARRVAG